MRTKFKGSKHTSDYVSHPETMARPTADKVPDGIGMSGSRKIMAVTGVDKAKLYTLVASFRLSVP